MNISRYNFFYQNQDINNKVIAYNSFTEAMAIISEENYYEYIKYEKERTPVSNKSFWEGLLDGGFLIEDKVDEIENLKRDFYQSKYMMDTFRLVIAPTMDCNFNCPYYNDA